ncbi:MAG: cation-transporting P-type ATPase [Nocardioidaceae bacterium]|nr:cation-transporting P-type ATPase [Nocardioidaceae bacterium]
MVHVHTAERQGAPTAPVAGDESSDARRPLDELLRDLHTTEQGLSAVESTRRLAVDGPNELSHPGGRRWPGQLLAQVTQPLVVLLVAAAALAWVGGTPAVSIAVLVVVVLNAGFAFVQEMQAERAVDALSAFLPPTARVVRDGVLGEVEARTLVPGDLMLVAEGDRVCADGRIVTGTASLDLSSLTGEAVPVSRSADRRERTGVLLEARELVFSGTTCTAGELRVAVTRTGMRTELGRIASLSQRGVVEPSPLEQQVRRATWVIAIVAVAVGAAFLPVGVAAGLGWAAAISFSIGLIVANVPEGLLPTITLALAAGVRDLARRGAVVKRLSAVETLGSTTVICTDKTGTLTENRMTVTRLWVGGRDLDADVSADVPGVRDLMTCAAACTTAQLAADPAAAGTGDPTELALLRLALARGVAVAPDVRTAGRVAVFAFDPHVKRMSTIDRALDGPTVHTKGALETVAPRCSHVLDGAGEAVTLDDEARLLLDAALDAYAAAGLRVLAVARRPAEPTPHGTDDRDRVESDLTLLGLVAMVDRARPGVAEAVADAHRAGITIHVITGDYGPTAAAIAHQVGIGADGGPIVAGGDLDAMSDSELDAVLAGDAEIVFARTSPEGKLRICRGLQARGEVVAMTGDGVNDAPALRHADIGVAMGRSGTDVARDAATMVLTDDNFATIVAAVAEGRRVFDNVRKFVLYIFAHAVPEVVPFLVFALSGGTVPLPLTVLQILAIDIGTETLPALALGREPAEPGLMERRPRGRSAGVIDRGLLLRAWALMGAVSAVLVMGAYLWSLWSSGWRPGGGTGTEQISHQAYLEATTITFLAIVACQIGTAFASRTDHASLRTVGILTNPLLLWGIVFELVFTAALVYLPWLQDVFGTAALSPTQLLIVVPFPFVVWGVDEMFRLRHRRTAGGHRGGDQGPARTGTSAVVAGAHDPAPAGARSRGWGHGRAPRRPGTQETS